jgi:hypothetical protein
MFGAEDGMNLPERLLSALSKTHKRAHTHTQSKTYETINQSAPSSLYSQLRNSFCERLELLQNAFWPFSAERLLKTRAVSPLKIKISSKNMREKPINTAVIHSVPQHALPQYSIDCSSIEHLSEGTRDAP